MQLFRERINSTTHMCKCPICADPPAASIINASVTKARDEMLESMSIGSVSINSGSKRKLQRGVSDQPIIL